MPCYSGLVMIALNKKFCVLFLLNLNYAVNVSDYIVSNYNDWWIINWKIIERSSDGAFLEGLRKTTRNLGNRIRSAERDLNPNLLNKKVEC
jgi:hypothetical protein